MLERINDQIEADIWNIQQLINRLPHATTKGEYRSIGAAIKVLVKEIHNAKILLEHKIWYADECVRLPLFECEPSPVDIMTEYSELDSFFGKID